MKIRQIPIKNLQVIQRLDLIAQDFLKLPHHWKNSPLPDISIAKLRELQADENFNGFPTRSNNKDWVNRYDLNHNFRERMEALVGSFNMLAGTSNFYWDSVVFQPPETGWTPWHNSKLKPRHFVKFIYNSGKGKTHAVQGDKRFKLEDQHNPTTTKDWTCIVGTMEGDLWVADRNYGTKPRIILDMSIPTIYHGEFAIVEEFISSVQVG